MQARPKIDWSIIRYLLVGAANTLFGLTVIYILLWQTDLGNVRVNLIGYACGIVMSFVLNARWTFQYVGPVMPAFLRFLVVMGVAYLANLGTVLVAANLMMLNDYLAQTIGVFPYVAVGYAGSRFVAFNKRSDRDAARPGA